VPDILETMKDKYAELRDLVAPIFDDFRELIRLGLRIQSHDLDAPSRA
jgi:hypothetical protein